MIKVLKINSTNMKKKLSEKQKQILKEARMEALEKLAKTSGLVCRIGKDIEIWADRYQYTLRIYGNYNYTTYHSTINQVLEELREFKEKELMLASEDKNLISVQRAIQDAQKWMERVVKPLF